MPNFTNRVSWDSPSVKGIPLSLTKRMLTTLSSRSLRLSERLFVMRPHSQNTDDTLLDEHFIHQSMLDIDSAGISAREITNQLLVRRWVLTRVSIQYSNPCLHFGLEASRSRPEVRRV